MELSGSHEMLSIGTAVATAYCVADAISKSIYSTEKIIGVPHMPAVSDAPRSMTAADVMSDEVPTIWGDATPAEVKAILNTTSTVLFPVVVSRGDFRLIGDVGFVNLNLYAAQQELSPYVRSDRVSTDSTHSHLSSRRHTSLACDDQTIGQLIQFLESIEAQGQSTSYSTKDSDRVGQHLSMEGILRDVLTVPHHANIKMVAKLFEAHSPNRVYVTDKGTLVGCIFKRHLVADGWTKPQHGDIAQASGVDTSVWQPKRP